MHCVALTCDEGGAGDRAWNLLGAAVSSSLQAPCTNSNCQPADCSVSPRTQAIMSLTAQGRVAGAAPLVDHGVAVGAPVAVGGEAHPPRGAHVSVGKQDAPPGGVGVRSRPPTAARNLRYRDVPVAKQTVCTLLRADNGTTSPDLTQHAWSPAQKLQE